MSDESPANPLQEKTPAELEHLKLAAEVEKLQAENKVFTHPLRRAATFASIVVAVGSLASLWIQYQTNTLREETVALDAQRTVAVAESDRDRAVAEATRVEEQLRQHQMRLLRGVVANLDSTQAALPPYAAGDWRRVSRLKDSNRAVEELLSLALDMGLLPKSLQDDLERLQLHYAEWLTAYVARFPDGVPRPHSPAIFVGSFPHQAEANIKRCLEDFEGGASDCAA